MRKSRGTARRCSARGAGRPASVARLGGPGLLLAAVLTVGLSGCSAADAGGEPAVPTSTPTATARPEPSIPPTPDASLSPTQNLAYFDRAVKAVLAKDASAPGEKLLQALAAAGFDPATMEVTPDRTTADLEADSIQFSVLFDGECLVGQRGPEDHGYHSMVAAPLGTGRCLLGSAAK